jgi:hypothetical protein
MRRIFIGETREYITPQGKYVIRDIWDSPKMNKLIRCEYQTIDKDGKHWTPCREGSKFHEIKPIYLYRFKA